MSSEAEASAALKLCEAESPLPCVLNEDSVGLKKWTSQYALPRQTSAMLKRRVADAVSAYDIQQREEEARVKRESEPDEEGWIKVTRKRKSTQAQVS